MEGGRQAEVAKAILTAKNVPYCVAAPLLIQDMASWVQVGYPPPGVGADITAAGLNAPTRQPPGCPPLEPSPAGPRPVRCPLSCGPKP